MDELRLKNALRCQFQNGEKYCIKCPYNTDGNKCNIAMISSDAITYIKTAEQLIASLQDKIANLTQK